MEVWKHRNGEVLIGCVGLARGVDVVAGVVLVEKFRIAQFRAGLAVEIFRRLLKQHLKLRSIVIVAVVT